MSDPSKVVSVLIRDVLFLGNIIASGQDSSYDTAGALTITVPYGNLTVLFHNVSFLYSKASKGCSTLYSNAYFQDITIEDSSFLGNSQDERFSYEWKIFQIVSTLLRFDLITTVISGNNATMPRAQDRRLSDNVLVTAQHQAQVNIRGLHYFKYKGGGICIQLLSEASFYRINGSTFLLQDSYFENNAFFSFSLLIKTNMTLLRMTRCIFRTNTLESSLFSSAPLFSLYVFFQWNQTSVEGAMFENNTVKGRIVLFLFPDLNNPDDCNLPGWNYINHVRLTNVTFQNNDPINSTVIRLDNGCNILSNCQFVDNSAVYTVFVGESSTNLQLVNTSFEKTPHWIKAGRGEFVSPSGFRGFIYFASSGPLKLENTTLKAQSFQDIDAYFMVTGSNSAHIDNSSVIQCPIGTLQTLINFTHLRLVNCHNVAYYILSQSFTFSCKRCSSGFYSVEPFAEKCRPCPYGGNCTNNIAAKPTFWGFPSLSDRGSVSFQQCPIDYCCAYRNVSCPFDNHRYLSSGCSGNRAGFCAESVHLVLQKHSSLHDVERATTITITGSGLLRCSTAWRLPSSSFGSIP